MNTGITTIIFSILRQAITATGAFLVAKGAIAAGSFDADAVTGAVMTLVSVGWSVYAARKSATQKVALAEQVEGAGLKPVVEVKK